MSRAGELRVRNLHASFDTAAGPVHAVRGVSFDVAPGERFGIVGESGSGKSVTAHSLLRLMPDARLSGEILLDGTDLLALDDRQLRAVRGRRIGMVFQDPMNALNPLRTIGSQVMEAGAHRGLSPADARAEALDRLAELGIPNPVARFSAFPHQFSGGMRQRVVIAAALMGDPDVLVADEPTTALDVRLQARLMESLLELSEGRGMSVVLISHDLDLVTGFAHRVAVMYAGAIRELAPAVEFRHRPSHPYTRGLLRSIPRIGFDRSVRLEPVAGSPPSLLLHPPGCAFAPRCPDRSPVCTVEPPVLATLEGVAGGGRTVACHHPYPADGDPVVAVAPTNGRPVERAPLPARPGPDLVVVENLVVEHAERDRGTFRAVNDVSFRIPRGSCFGLVGESGSGKTTTARAVLRLAEPTSGRIHFDGKPIGGLGRRDLTTLRRRMQLVYQDPQSSLDGRMTAGAIVEEALLFHARRPDARGRKERVRALFGQVGLGEDLMAARPRSLSGGQMQRVAIARALALDPELLVCDEVVSALDVSVQAKILNLLADLRHEYDLTMLFISHDLGVVSYLCDQVAVMYRGEIVETGPTRDVLGAPAHAYTKELIEASPHIAADGHARPPGP